MDRDFAPRIGNDAYGAIRGFVYQVDLTVERWLDVSEGQRLELERGEDIDHVARALINGESTDEGRPFGTHRLLEQVKHLQRPITLRSSGVRAALCNAYEHLCANPGHDLLFRFTTTAFAGVEARSPLPGRIAGIRAWERLRQTGTGGSGEPAHLQGIRSLLQARKRPKGVAAAAWSRFQEFVESGDTERFLGFIRRFEWSTGAPGAEARSEQVITKLMQQSRADSREEARTAYERLFVYVFHLLSQPGLKSLDSADLERTLAQPTLPPRDRQLLRTLKAAFGQIEQRVGTVELALAEYKAALPAIHGRLDSLAREQGIKATIEYTVAAPDLDPPPPLTVGAAREKTVRWLWHVVQQHTWTALVGAATTGKTQLVGNMVRAQAPGARWLRLRDLSVAEAALRLDKAAEGSAGHRAERSIREWYGSMTERARTSEVLVLDDVPRFRTGDELAVRLDALVHACDAAGVRLVTTSAYPLPASFSELHSAERVVTTEVPPFTDEEARELLLARGAPAKVLTPSYVRLLRTMTHDGNPALLQAMARHLSHTGWAPDVALTAFVTKEYSAEVNAETVHRVLDTVESRESRNLLYRLNLVTGEFSMKQVAVLAEVAPAIMHPRERLEQLRGLWVQTESLDRFSVSPLIRTLGSEDLPRAVVLECHLALAGEILRRGSVNQLEASQALSHLAAGGDYNGAAIVLLQGLEALARVEGEVWDAALGAIWIDLPLPPQIDLALRLQIRAFQVRLRAKQGKDVSSLLADFDKLLEKAGEHEAWSVYGATLVVSGSLVPLNVRGAGKYMSLMQRTSRALPAEYAKLLPEAEKLDPASLLWWAAAEVDAEEAGMVAWLSNIEALQPATRAAAFATSQGDQAAVHVANSFYLAENDRPSDERDWNRVLSAMDVLERRGRELELEQIWRAAVCIRITVTATGVNDLDGARILAETVLEQPGIEPRTRFRVRAALGYVYVDTARVAEARQWLAAAREDAAAAPKSEAVRLLLMRSKLAGSDSASDAVKYAEEAGAIATEAGRMKGYLDAKAFGEIAVARWLNGDLRGAFSAWEHVAERVLEVYPGDAEWKKLYVPFTHGTGYFFGLATQDDPSAPLDLSGYAPPYRGMFLDTTWNLNGPAVVPEAYVCVHTAIFAEGVGEHDRARRWAERGLNTAGSSSHSVRGMLIPITLVDALQQRRFTDAYTLSRDAGAIFVSQGQLRAAGADTLAAYDIEGLLGPREAVAWDDVEAFPLNTGVVPALLQIGILSVARPEHYAAALRAAADACTLVGRESTRPSTWNEAASVLRMLSSGAPFADLVHIANAVESPISHSGAAVYQLSLLAASLAPGAALVGALETHLAAVRHIKVYLYSQPSLRRIAIPFFFDYWNRRLVSDRLHFSSPTLVERRIKEAARLSQRERLSGLFQAVADGLGVRMAPAVPG